MTTAAIYARVSTEMQAEDEVPILGQVQECRRLAEGRGWEVVAVYKDEGYTGRNTDRPQYQQLIVDAHHRKFDKVIIWKGSRIARNVEDRLAFDSLMQRQGIDVVPVNEPEFDGSVRILMLPIMAAVDAYQSHLIAEDTLRGLKTLAEQGYSAGGRPPRGYRTAREVVGLKRNGEPRFRTKWEPDPEWRDRALKAFQMVADGRSAEEIIEETGVVRNKSSLCTYFRNPVFIGERVFNVHQRRRERVVKVPLDDPSVIRIPGAHEAIIPRDLFDHVQVVLEKRRPQAGQMRARRHDFVLSGLLWCATHDCPMTGFGNKENRYYACETYRRGGRKKSDCPLLRKDALEAFVWEILQEQVFTSAKVREGLQYLKTTARAERRQMHLEASRVQAQIRKLDQELKNLHQAVADGMALHLLEEPIKERVERKAQLERDLAELKEKRTRSMGDIQVTDDVVEELRCQVIEAGQKEDPEARRAFLRTVVERIEIAGDSVTIHFVVTPPATSCQVLVAGVGFEPTTSGL